MKIACISDLHFGARNANLSFLEHQLHFFNQQLIPLLVSENLPLLISGDIFDNRLHTNNLVFQKAIEEFFDKLYALDINVCVLEGNHDSYYRNTNTISPLFLLKRLYPKWTFALEQPVTALNGSVLLVPWINSSNHSACLEAITAFKGDLIATHFDFSSNEDVLLELQANKAIKITGHYHKRGIYNGLLCVGSCFKQNFGELYHEAGISIIDMASKKTEFIPNSSDFVIAFDSIPSLLDSDKNELAGKYVRLVVEQPLSVEDRRSIQHIHSLCANFTIFQKPTSFERDATISLSDSERGSVVTFEDAVRLYFKDEDSLEAVNLVAKYMKMAEEV